MQPSPRIENMLKKFAPIIGGEDDSGQIHRIPDDARLKQHLFYVKNRDEDNVSGEFMLGHVIRGKIIDGIYDIEYVGLNRYTRRPRENETIAKEHQKVLDRVKVLGERQARDIRQAKVAHYESLGIFVSEDELDQAPTP